MDWNGFTHVFHFILNDDEPASQRKRAHVCALFSIVSDPLVARHVFFRMSCCPRENSLLEFVFSRLFFGHSDHVLLSTVRKRCLSATKPARNPKKVDPYARYGPYDFGGLRSFMVDPSCLYEKVQEKILCFFRCRVNRNLYKN